MYRREFHHSLPSYNFDTTKMFLDKHFCTKCLFIFGLMWIITATESSEGEASKEVCENETFEAKCKAKEVIIMTEALYGRMDFGRCIDRDYGYVGCFADVLGQSDRLCSGREKCDIRIPEPTFTELKPCPRDLKPYLKASYDCMKVEIPSSTSCHSSKRLSLTTNHGFLASSVTETTGYGSADCPWLIQAQPGQQVNLTLHDFATSQGKADICHAYAIVRERTPTRSVTVCNGDTKIKSVYLSASNEIEIRILRSKGMPNDRQFVIEYQVQGCPTPVTTNNVWVEREGDNLKMGCTFSEKKWQLRCSGREWIGTKENCTKGLPIKGAVGDQQWGFVNLPMSLSVIIIIVIALAIGVVFLIVSLTCLRWQRRKKANRDIDRIYGESHYQVTGQKPPPYSTAHNYHNQMRQLPWPPENDHQEVEPIYADANEYSYISDFPPPPQNLPPIPQAGYVSQPQDGSEPPKYFTLDPSAPQHSRGKFDATERYIKANNRSHDGKSRELSIHKPPPSTTINEASQCLYNTYQTRDMSKNDSTCGSNVTI